eukprot:3274307-Prorocentrum_lima.AAC.1
MCIRDSTPSGKYPSGKQVNARCPSDVPMHNSSLFTSKATPYGPFLKSAWLRASLPATQPAPHCKAVRQS